MTQDLLGADPAALDRTARAFHRAAEQTTQILTQLKDNPVSAIASGPRAARLDTTLDTDILPRLHQLTQALANADTVLTTRAEAQRTLARGGSIDTTRLPQYQTPAAPEPISRPATVAQAKADPKCRITATVNLPSGTLKATPQPDGRLAAPWDMSVEFHTDPDDPGKCGHCGEYRQYVRGVFTATPAGEDGGPTQAHPSLKNFNTLDMCGVPLSPSKYQEDCLIGNNSEGKQTQLRYGRHDTAFHTSNFSSPDQQTGTVWRGWDSPGSVMFGNLYQKVDLEFRGEVINRCDIDENGRFPVLHRSEWKVQGEWRPGPGASPDPSSLPQLPLSR